ncbi:helix-turn-helix transcriptional regulator [Cellulomonas alba]|uniref:ArsR family transcriptional regulator n=1 Tax=Cellulomonas alba TaxID=3053467 RepID=A0ABT7SI98_9CELL|nr:helix-turn-helix domain-containing protein [Cellulomonas alba]MDM7855907.1 ArsR family transcriptional regulator [Cellulomonas alba]
MTTRRTPAARTLASVSRVELLDLLQQRGPATVGELAAATGLHENTTREHLQRLVDEGYAVRTPEHRTVRGRPRMIYRARTADDVRADPVARRRLEDAIASAALTEALLRDYGRSAASPAETAVRAGRDTALERAAADARGTVDDADLTSATTPEARQLLALEHHLDSMGFDPELEESAPRFHMWRCPFLALARSRPEVVCNVHLGLAAGVLEAAGGPVRAVAIQPWVAERHCILELDRRPGTRTPAAGPVPTAPVRAQHLDGARDGPRP